MKHQRFNARRLQSRSLGAIAKTDKLGDNVFHSRCIGRVGAIAVVPGWGDVARGLVVLNHADGAKGRRLTMRVGR